MNADDLLSFKEYPPIHDNYARGGGVAEININSPSRTLPTNTFGDQHLHDLVNDMSTSVQAMNSQQGSSGAQHQQQSPPSIGKNSQKGVLIGIFN